MVTIRRATMADAVPITEAHVCSWQRAYRGLIPQDYLDGLEPAQRVARWEENLTLVDWSAGGVLVAEDRSGVAGFASFGPTRDDDDRRLVGEIMAIYLAPYAWGKGFGRELMAAAVGALAAMGYGLAMLWVLDGNERARRFYDAAGFQPDGAVKEDRSYGFVLNEVRYRRLLP